MKIALKALLGTALAMILLLAQAQIPAFAQGPRNTQDEQQLEASREVSANTKKEERIEGVWESHVTIINCQSGVSIVTFRAMEMFIRGGSLVDTNANPPATRGPGFGRWEFLGGRQYVATFRFFLYNADGTFTGVRRVIRTIELGVGGDTLTSTVSIEVFDPDGNLTATSCGTETAMRVEYRQSRVILVWSKPTIIAA